MKRFVFTVEGMMCGMCEAHAQDAARKISGVLSAKASRAANSVTVTMEDFVSPDDISAAIAETGYDVKGYEKAPEEKKGFFGRLFKK